MPRATYQVMESIFKPNIVQIENLVKHISWSTGLPYYIGRQALGIEMQKLASMGPLRDSKLGILARILFF